MNRPAWTLGRHEVPAEWSVHRAWRWCVLRTVREATLARRKGRPITKLHLARLFSRRWHKMLNQMDELDNQRFLKMLNHGRHFIRKG